VYSRESTALAAQPAEPQVPPLRYAPVGMTIHSQELASAPVNEVEVDCTTKLSSRPERTRISYISVPHEVTYAAFRKESRTKFANATKLDRKSGGA
jgi:hypothetical protein